MQKIRIFKAPVLTLVFMLLSSALLAAEEQNLTGQPGSQPAYLQAVWWNQDLMAEKLALGKTEREQFDQIAVVYVEQRKLLQESAASLQLEYAETLAAGDSVKASQANQSLADLGKNMTLSQRQLKIDIVSMLEDKQRELLVAEFPQLLNKAWFKKKQSRRKSAQ